MDLWLNPAARDWRGGRRADRRTFHAALPAYRPTPLHSVPGLAAALGVGAVLVKDESDRFGLPAFKVLGASWAAHRALCERLGVAAETLTVADLRRSLAERPDAAELGLLTATAGNHGRALARVGRWLGLPTVVLVPHGTGQEVVEPIAGEGAQVRVVDGSYDDAVREAAGIAAAHPERVLVQDTAWTGYESVPEWVVEGYQTIFHEVTAQLAEPGRGADLVVVPIGVGSLMSAAIQYYRSPAGPAPALLGVEPVTAACALASLRAGRPVITPTGTTVMGGLNAGTVSSTAWPLLRDGLDAATAVTDEQARNAQAELLNRGIRVGCCAAATLPAVTHAVTDEGRAALGLTGTSTVILIATDAAAS